MISDAGAVDQDIQSVLNDDWSFSHLSRSETLWGTHGYHRYPAKFIPQLARRIIELYSEPNERIGDLFVGSGTTGVEAIRAGRTFYGSDINHVALFISRAKCIPIEPQKLSEQCKILLAKVDKLHRIGRLPLTLKQKDFIETFDLRNTENPKRIDYWFPLKHKKLLKEILQETLTTEDMLIRNFALCGFSNILRRCSIWLSGSTKPQKDINKTLSDPVDEFSKQIRNMVSRNELYWNDLVASDISPETITEKCNIEWQDARQPNVETASIQLLVTSPPYATCYDYNQLHQLSQLWFEKYGVIPNSSNNLAWIGSEQKTSRTGSKHYSESLDFSQTAEKIVTSLGNIKSEGNADIDRETTALRYYFHDMWYAVQEFRQLISPGGKLVFVIGDSYKRGVEIKTSLALQEMTVNAGFSFVTRIPRKVAGRVLVSKRDKETGRFSSTAESTSEVYPEEDILVFKRDN